MPDLTEVRATVFDVYRSVNAQFARLYLLRSKPGDGHGYQFVSVPGSVNGFLPSGWKPFDAEGDEIDLIVGIPPTNRTPASLLRKIGAVAYTDHYVKNPGLYVYSKVKRQETVINFLVVWLFYFKKTGEAVTLPAGGAGTGRFPLRFPFRVTDGE